MPSENRLHPASILFGLISQVREFAVPLVVALVAGSQRGGFDTIAWIVLIPYTLVALGRYFFFTYRFDPHELVVRSGLLVRNERHIPYGRIQNLDAVENVLHRALGVVDVRIDTGSGSDTDATLSVVTRAAYEDMRRRVFAGREATAGPAISTSARISSYATTRPSCFTGMPNRADAPQMRMSQRHAISSPPPMQAPWIMAMTGCRHVLTASSAP